MSSSATARVNIIVGAIDHASRNVNGIIKGLTKKFAGFARLFKKIFQPHVDITDAQKELNKLSLKQAGRNIEMGVNAAQRKINSLTAGNAPNRIARSFQQSFARIQRQTESLKKTIQTIANVTIAAYGLEDFGKKVTSALQAPVQAGMNFEAAMSKVSAVTLSTIRKQDSIAGTNLAAQALDALTAKARAIGAATKWSATEIAEGMSFLGMAGMEAKDILVSMRGVADLAAAGGIGLARASDIASNVATAMFGKNDAANQMKRLGDVMAHTITNFNVDMVMLGETMKYAAPIAAKTGVSLETLSAAAGILGNSGIQASMAGTTLRKSLTRLASPPRVAADALKYLGVQTYEIDKKTGAKNLRKFPEILKDIAKAMDAKKLGTATRTGLLADIAGLTAVSGFATLVSSAKNGELDNEIARMGDKGSKIVGTAQAVSSEMIRNLKGDLAILGSVTEALKISIYNTVQPILRIIVKGITQVVGKINDWVQAHEPLVKKIMMVTAAVAGAAIGIAVFLKGAAASVLIFSVLKAAFVGVSAFAVPLAALAGVGMLIYRYWQPLGAFFTGFLDGLKNGFEPVIPVFESLAVLFSPIAELFSGLFTPIKHSTELLLGFSNTGQFVGAILGASIAKIINSVRILGVLIGKGVAFLANLKLPELNFSNFSLPSLTNFANFGTALILTISAGIESARQAFWNAILGVFSFTRPLFPSSDAKAGPLSKLTFYGLKIITTIAKGVISGGGILANVLKNIFAMPIVLAMAAFSGLGLVLSGNLGTFWDNIRNAFPKDLSGLMLATIMSAFVAVEVLITIFVGKIRKKIGGKLITTTLGMALKGLFVSNPVTAALLLGAEMLSGVLLSTLIYKLWAGVGGFDLSGVWMKLLENFTGIGKKISNATSTIGASFQNGLAQAAELGWSGMISGSLQAIRDGLATAGSALWTGFWNILRSVFDIGIWDVIKTFISTISTISWEYLKLPFTMLGDIGSVLGLGVIMGGISALFMKVEIATGNVTQKVNLLKNAFQTKQLFAFQTWKLLFIKFVSTFGGYLRFLIYPLERLFFLSKFLIFLPKLIGIMVKSSPLGKNANLIAFTHAGDSISRMAKELFSVQRNFAAIGIVLSFVVKWVFGLNTKFLILRATIIASAAGLKYWWSGFMQVAPAIGIAFKEAGVHVSALWADLKTLPFGSIITAIGTITGHIILGITHIFNRLMQFREWLNEVFEDKGTGTLVFAGFIAAFVGALAFMRMRYKRFLMTTFVANPNQAGGCQQRLAEQKGGTLRKMYAFATRKKPEGVRSVTDTCGSIASCFTPQGNLQKKSKRWWQFFKKKTSEMTGSACTTMQSCFFPTSQVITKKSKGLLGFFRKAKQVTKQVNFCDSFKGCAMNMDQLSKTHEKASRKAGNSWVNNFGKAVKRENKLIANSFRKLVAIKINPYQSSLSNERRSNATSIFYRQKPEPVGYKQKPSGIFSNRVGPAKPVIQPKVEPFTKPSKTIIEHPKQLTTSPILANNNLSSAQKQQLCVICCGKCGGTTNSSATNPIAKKIAKKVATPPIDQSKLNKRAWEIAREKAGGKKGSKAHFAQGLKQAEQEFTRKKFKSFAEMQREADERDRRKPKQMWATGQTRMKPDPKFGGRDDFMNRQFPSFNERRKELANKDKLAKQKVSQDKKQHQKLVAVQQQRQNALESSRRIREQLERDYQQLQKKENVSKQASIKEKVRQKWRIFQSNSAKQAAARQERKLIENRLYQEGLSSQRTTQQANFIQKQDKVNRLGGGAISSNSSSQIKAVPTPIIRQAPTNKGKQKAPSLLQRFRENSKKLLPSKAQPVVAPSKQMDMFGGGGQVPAKAVPQTPFWQRAKNKIFKPKAVAATVAPKQMDIFSNKQAVTQNRVSQADKALRDTAIHNRRIDVAAKKERFTSEKRAALLAKRKQLQERLYQQKPYYPPTTKADFVRRESYSSAKVQKARLDRRLRESQFRIKEKAYVQNRNTVQNKVTPKGIKTALKRSQQHLLDLGGSITSSMSSGWDNFKKKTGNTFNKIGGFFSRIRGGFAVFFDSARQRVENGIAALDKKLSTQQMSDKQIGQWTKNQSKLLRAKGMAFERAEKQAARESMKFFKPTLFERASGYLDAGRNGQSRSDERIKSWTDNRTAQLEKGSLIKKALSHEQAKVKAARESMKFFKPTLFQKAAIGFADKVKASADDITNRQKKAQQLRIEQQQQARSQQIQQAAKAQEERIKGIEAARKREQKEIFREQKIAKKEKSKLIAKKLSAERIQEQTQRQMNELAKMGLGSKLSPDTSIRQTSPPKTHNLGTLFRRPPTPNIDLQGKYEQYDDGKANPNSGMGQRRRHLKGGAGLLIAAGTAGMLMSGGNAQAGELNQTTESVSLLTVALEKGKMAWQYFKENMASVGMLALTISTMLFDPIVLLGVLSKVALIAGAAFLGWKIGEWLNQFEVVREGARIVVTAILDFGFATAAAISGWWTNSVQPAFANLAGFISFAWQELTLSFANLGFLGTLEAFGNLIESSLNNLWAGLGTVIMAPVRLLADVITIVGTMVGQVVGAIASGNWADAGMAILRAIGAGALAAASFLLDGLSGVFQMGISLITTWLPRMLGFGGDMLLYLARGIFGSKNKILNAIQDLWNAMKAKLSAMIEAIGNTLKRGIQQKFSGLKESVRSAFKSITNLFPHSDAKEGPFKHLTASGRAIMTTMAIGVRKGEGSLGKSLSNSLAYAQKSINANPIQLQAIGNSASHQPTASNALNSLNQTLLKLNRINKGLEKRQSNSLLDNLPLSIPQVAAEIEVANDNYTAIDGSSDLIGNAKTNNISFGDIIVNVSGGDRNNFDAKELAIVVREHLDMSLDEQLRRSMYDYA